MAFRRAAWRSGLTYEQTCPQCRTVVRYMDDRLDFRPWFADGFVYCPTCRKPLRHNEIYAINRPQNAPFVVDMTQPPFAPGYSQQPQAVFCTQCGTRFEENAHFCSECGAKR